MITEQEQQKKIRQQIGYLFEKELLQEIFNVGKTKKVPMDSTILEPGESLLYIPFIIDGSVKVSRENEDGEEFLLYYIERGDTCAMTLQCCVKNSKSEIKATAIEESEILLIPNRYMEVWLGKYISWRNYILDSYHYRLSEMMETIDSIVFMRLDERLERYLKDHAKLLGSLEINLTHQQIAEDLHSSRVVISRLLKQMERNGMIQIQRNKIVLSSI